jgi:CRP/FNR family transcriptional regulator, cyclic AMP receptor protein
MESKFNNFSLVGREKMGNNKSLSMLKSDFIRYVPIFADLNEDTIEEISQLGRIKNYTKDAVILYEQESGTALFIIVKGQVKISRIGDDGKEVILTILKEDDFFGEMAILDGFSRSANVTAMEDTEIFIIQRDEFIKLLETHPEISLALLTELTNRLRDADAKIKALSIKDAEGRVGTVIIQIADTMGKIKNGAVEIERIPYQHDLANMAGTSRETISRTLHSFAKKGLIELNGSNIKIPDFEKFKELYQ